MRGRLDAEIRRIVKRIDNRYAGRERAENRLDLPDVEVVRPEVGEQDDQAAFFASGFFAGSTLSCGLSISVTSASGALSPFLKPFFRIRR